MYEHQDWKTVTLRTKQEGSGRGEKSVRQAQQHGAQIESSIKRTHNGSSSTIVSVKKLDDNPESFAHKKIPKHIADAIQKKRLELKMTQLSLAQKINEKPNVIQDIEGAKGVYNHVLVNKTLRILGLSLKNVNATH
jgi:ribosome-binding protein aMBF1 (putative translation factor)